MKPENAVHEYTSALVLGIRFVCVLALSAMIAGKLSKLMGTDNFIVYCLVFIGLVVLLNKILEALFTRRKLAPEEE
ncbi:hypothetical protein ACFQDN_25570 [Pseudomonas asuensis]|uniref:hypothetical protein n=1 Tax=Pseudomonas asuensis TaxID=1825787 RepID=UPI00166A174D|nr:hypothetical protein [Pseudomonas asuensis]